MLKQLDREAREAEKLEKELNEKRRKQSKGKENGKSEDSLVVALMERKKERESMADGFFDHLLSRYGSNSNTPKDKKKTPKAKRSKK